ncbi:hypothetical protein [Lewinella sp. 4G2]|uniref:hypothetical protein n=1 Tax=Lewinella sp. 4G2 TaxID=1803372 RepID=UPI0007B4C466|nr:hypothetical protein [Lewinella sp. 4G2]OAV44088.1 hypothetical protein A3850_006060 [Lewinella sp. 4G2]
MTLQIDLLDEKGMEILNGLQKLNVIKIHPFREDSATNTSTLDGTTKLEVEPKCDEQEESILDFIGVWGTSKTIEETDAEIAEMRAGWL